MRIIETFATITDKHLLTVELPEDIETGEYQIVIIINSQPETKPKQELKQDGALNLILPSPN